MKIALPMTAGIAALAVAGLAATALASSSSAAPAERAHPGRGTVVSAALDARLTVSQTGAYLRNRGYATPAPQFGVDVYRVVCRTVDARGGATTASGVVLSRTHPRSRRTTAPR